MSYTKYSLIAILLTLIASLQVNAQIVKIPGSEARVVVNSSMPHRGLTKVQVESKFGQPNSKSGPVGDPTIYRWDYEGYSVIFEDNYVIHSVAH